jgi:hypothetical protein
MLKGSKIYKIKKITMAEVYDAEGNLIEGYLSPEEVAAKIEAEKAEWAKIKPPAPVTTEQKSNEDEPPAWFKPFAEQVQKLSGNQTSTFIKDYVSNLDADKQKEFDAKFNSLTGYDDSPEGIQKRAQDAYLLTTGQPYNATAVNMQNIVASTGGPVRPSAPKPEVDKGIQEVLGITEEDANKYASK